MFDGEPEDLPLGREVGIEPGVFVERRDFCATAAKALALAGLVPRTAFAMLRPSDAIDFAEFLAEALPAARRLVSDTSADGQAVYLRTLAEHATRLDDAPRPAWSDSQQSNGPGTFIGANPGPD